MELYLGVDIGGTSTKIGVVRDDGAIICQTSIPTCETEDPAHFVERLREKLDGLLLTHAPAETKFLPVASSMICAVGVGAPNGNFYSGQIEYAPNLKWSGIVPIASMIEESLNLKTYVTNDANAAALGELKFGSARGMKDFVVLTLGTGLGSGIVSNGQLVYGKSGFAGEFGHVIAIRGGRNCGCGRRGCLETYVSATGVVTTAYEKLNALGIPSILRGSDSLTASDVADAAKSGDELALEVFEQTGALLGEQLADLAAITSPEAIFLMGGLARAGELLFQPVRRHFEMNLLNVLRSAITIFPTGLDEDNSAILGAAAFAWCEKVSPVMG